MKTTKRKNYLHVLFYLFYCTTYVCVCIRYYLLIGAFVSVFLSLCLFLLTFLAFSLSHLNIIYINMRKKNDMTKQFFVFSICLYFSSFVYDDDVCSNKMKIKIGHDSILFFCFCFLFHI